METGVAYGFFGCPNPSEPIVDVLQDICTMFGVPKDFGYALSQDARSVNAADPEIQGIAERMHAAGATHVLEARRDGWTNERTAQELTDILFQLYQTNLFTEDQGMKAAVWYHNGQEYVKKQPGSLE